MDSDNLAGLPGYSELALRTFSILESVITPGIFFPFASNKQGVQSTSLS